MSIAKHVQSLQKHLAQFGLYQVQEETISEESAIFKICFLNHHEMQRWKEAQDREKTEEKILLRDEN